MPWHVTHYDEETGIAYRIRVKRLTVGDAVQADMLGDSITRRESLEGRELLLLSQHYPFVRYATATCEQALLVDAPTDTREGTGDPVVPDEAEWEPFELTEAAFLALPEWLVLRWQHEAIQKNPHRDPTYELLKKKLLRERLQSAMPIATPDAMPSENGDGTVSSSA